MKENEKKRTNTARLKGLLWLIPLLLVVVGWIGGLRLFIVMSGSMEPAIATGSICVVNTKASYEEIQKGEIIAYQTETGMRVTHRVVGKEANGLLTKGDANDFADGIVTGADNFIGKNIYSIPYIGYVLKFLQQPQVILGIMMLFICSCTLKKEMFTR